MRLDGSIHAVIMEDDGQSQTAQTLASDIPVALSHFNEIKKISLTVNQMLQNTIQRLRNNELPMNNGMSFLDVKNQMLLNYLLNISYLALKKSSGESIKGTSLIGG